MICMIANAAGILVYKTAKYHKSLLRAEHIRMKQEGRPDNTPKKCYRNPVSSNTGERGCPTCVKKLPRVWVHEVVGILRAATWISMRDSQSASAD